MKLAISLLIALLASGGTALAQARDSFSCGALKAETWRTGPVTSWSIVRGTDRTTETGTLRNPPRLECLADSVLTVEVAFTGGHGAFSAYFPDGSDITYGRQQIERRNNRIILPIQAKMRIAAPYRAAFDYHCKLSMPADPIPAASRAECVF